MAQAISHLCQYHYLLIQLAYWNDHLAVECQLVYQSFRYVIGSSDNNCVVRRVFCPALVSVTCFDVDVVVA